MKTGKWHGRKGGKKVNWRRKAEKVGGGFAIGIANDGAASFSDELRQNN
jgi:hypothetical protein